MRNALSIAVMTLLCSACGTSGPVPGNYCDIYKPVWLSPDDQLTRDTLRQIIRNNEVHEKLCEAR